MCKTLLLFIVAYLGGVLTILSPCILPILPFTFARAGQPFRKTGLPLFAGMAITFAPLASGAAAAVASRETGQIEHVERNGNIAVRLKNGCRVAWNLKEYNYLDHAYAMTSHSSQAIPVDRVLHKDRKLSFEHGRRNDRQRPMVAREEQTRHKEDRNA